MRELPLREDVVRWLAEHRQPLLTPILQAFTGLGELEGYILVVVLLYVAWDKRLAVRLAVLTLAAMMLNHGLKTLIANPRPFTRSGAYRELWAVSPERAAELATEFSTPSGHAMAGGAFYGYLAAVARNPYARAALVVCLLLIGVSRPYLGVHYVEDVLSGWALGLALAWLAVRRGPTIEARWGRLGDGTRLLLLLGASGALWLATFAAGPWSAADPPSAFVGYAGLLTGILAAGPLEARHVDFDPRGGGAWRTAARYALCVALVIGTLGLLGRAFAAAAAPGSPAGALLRYVRYAAAGFAGLYVAPRWFVAFGLATARVSRLTPAAARAPGVPGPRAGAGRRGR